MKYSYDEESDSLFICLRDGEYDESEEIYDGFVIDFDKSGRPLNIDIDHAAKGGDDIDHASKFVDIPRLFRSMAPRLKKQSNRLRKCSFVTHRSTRGAEAARAA